MRTFRAFTGTLIIFVLSGSLYAKDMPQEDYTKAGFTTEGVQRIDAMINAEISANRTPGAVIAIAKNGKIVLHRSYGYLDKEKNVPMPKDAVFNLASMTKVMAVVGALTFYEEGRMPLNAPISQWLPEFKNPKLAIVDADGKVIAQPIKREITVQDLMRHTNGLTYGARGQTPVHKLYPSSSLAAAADYSGKDFVAKLGDTPLLYEPGTTWDYGFGIDVLGLIAEKIAGKSLNDLLAERVWSKLDMKDTTFHVSDAMKPRLAQPLEIDPLTGKPQRILIYTRNIKFDCGGSCAYSTALDYLKFAQMLLNGGELNSARILGSRTVQFMTSDHLGDSVKNLVAGTEPGRAGYGFGLGVAVRKVRGVAAINGSPGDFFWNGANGTLFWVDPKENMVVVYMSAAPGEIRKVHRELVASVVYGALQ